jgi:hypothetical protein
VVAPDNMGLGPSNWTRIGGSMYGMGGGAEASFGPTVLVYTQVVADSCVSSDYPTSSAPSLFTPVQCPYSQRSHSLTATDAFTHCDTTGESNNLLPFGTPVFGCTTYECILGFWGISP